MVTCLLSPFLTPLGIHWVMRGTTKGKYNDIQWTLFDQLDNLSFADHLALLDLDLLFFYLLRFEFGSLRFGFRFGSLPFSPIVTQPWMRQEKTGLHTKGIKNNIVKDQHQCYQALGKPKWMMFNLLRIIMNLRELSKDEWKWCTNVFISENGHRFSSTDF